MPYKDPEEAREHRKKYYQDNKTKIDLRNRLWLEKNRTKHNENTRKLWHKKGKFSPALKLRLAKNYLKNQQYQKQYRIKYYQNPLNKEKRRIYSKQSELKNKEKRRKQKQIYYLNNKEKIDERNKRWGLLNPRSSMRYGIDLFEAMMNVRTRDKNTCQWQGCGLTFREAPIHVHHIFLRSEHPELQLVEQYMICYCMNHHALWHLYRGDKSANFLGMILPNKIVFRST